jgi:hypothetical protein
MKGIVTFFINIHPSEGQDVSATIELFKLANKELLEKINKDSDYVVAIVPTMKEACRVEKVDFDKPFPRAIPMSQREIESIEKRREERSTERALALKERELEFKKLEKMYRSEENDR